MNIKRIHFAVCILLFIIVSLVSFPSRNVELISELPVVGQTSQQTIIAPMDFDIPKTERELEMEQKRATEKIYPVFEYDYNATKRIYENFNDAMKQISDYAELQNKKSGKTADSGKADEIIESLRKKMSIAAVLHLVRSATVRDSLKSAFSYMLGEQGISNALVTNDIRNVAAFEERYNKQDYPHAIYSQNEVILVKNGRDSLVNVEFIIPKEIAIDSIIEKYRHVFNNNLELKSAFYEVLYTFALPNIIYMEKETERRRANAIAEISRIKYSIAHGTELIKKGSVVTDDVLEKLSALRTAQKNSYIDYTPTFYGQHLILLLVSAALCFYVWVYKPKRKIGLPHIWALTSIAVVQILLFKLSYVLTNEIQGILVQNELDRLNLYWLYPFSFAPMLTSIFFSLRTTGAITAWTSVIFGLFVGYDLSMCIAAYLTSLSMALIVNNIHYSVRFLQAMAIGLTVMAVSQIGILLLHNNMNLTSFIESVVLGLINIVVCITFISVIFRYLFERIFKFSTGLKLMELTNRNHPLLRRLSEYSSGTFQHCVEVGDLGEFVGARINANVMLIRLMALYHDIGKIVRPEYFTENQRNIYNPHSNLAPHDSFMIVRSHVEQGVKLAEEYGLPEEVIFGITEHHGNEVAFYFYNKAREMYPELTINEADFRYPGPIPQSKETAILMLADKIEATKRSRNARPDEFSKIVQDTIDTCLYYDQLNDSGLTPSDLKELKKGFLQGLENASHSRIRYETGAFPIKRLKKPEIGS